MATSAKPGRTVHHGEALAWLAAHPLPAGTSIVTSLPDLCELAPLTLPEWRRWFVDAAAAVVRACPERGVAIFYQTDIIEEGAWIDKSHLVQCGAEAAGGRLLWHRIVCRMPPGTPQFGRPAYAHLLAFSRGLTLPPHRARRDLLASTGEMSWSRAIGLEACVEAVRAAVELAGAQAICDPFCGHGTALAVANALGLPAVGVELSRKRVRKARALTVVLASPEEGGPRVVRGGLTAADGEAITPREREPE